MLTGQKKKKKKETDRFVYRVAAQLKKHIEPSQDHDRKVEVFYISH